MGFELSNFNQDTWDCLVSTGHEHHLEPTHNSSDRLPSLADEWLTDAELHACAVQQRQEQFRQRERHPWTPGPNPPATLTPPGHPVQREPFAPQGTPPLQSPPSSRVPVPMPNSQVDPTQSPREPPTFLRELLPDFEMEDPNEDPDEVIMPNKGVCTHSGCLSHPSPMLI